MKTKTSPTLFSTERLGHPEAKADRKGAEVVELARSSGDQSSRLEGRRTPDLGANIGGTFANLDDARDYAAKASIAGDVGIYEVLGSYRVSLITKANLVAQFRNGEELPAKTSKGA